MVKLDATNTLLFFFDSPNAIELNNMKKIPKIVILLLFTAIVACNKNTNQETKNNEVLWAENVQTILPMEPDTTDPYWSEKEKIFSSIVPAVLSGKLKAYANYPSPPLTLKEFNNILVKWDTTQVENPANPGVFFTVPVKIELTSDRITGIKFNEKIELDTISFSISQKVSYITFLTYKENETGEIMGNKKLFDVKLNDLPNNLNGK